MNRMNTAKAAALSCVMAAAVACGGGNRNDQNTAAPNGSPATPNAQSSQNAEQKQPITLTGCLQKGGSGNDFILTEVNEPQNPPVTKGESNGSAVDRAELREARNAYRLDPQGDVKLDDMVGKQIRVNGTLTERADLPAATSGTDTDRSAAAAAPNNRVRASNGSDDTQKIDESNLAQVSVTDATMTAGTCGAAANGHAAGKASRKQK